MPFDGPEADDEGFFPASAPASVSSTSPGPEASSLPPLHPTEPHPEEQTPEAGSEEGPSSDEALPEFDSQFREPFEGLLFIGALTRRFTWMGHEFTIRTINADEMMEIGLVTRDFSGTVGEIRAYTTSVVAACLLTIDGKPMPQPITSDVADTPLRNRFDWVKRLYPLTIDTIYNEYLALENVANQVVEAMGKVSLPRVLTPG